MHFERPDIKRFPALALAYEAGRIGGSMPAVLNAANEVAVAAFLNRKISFLSIVQIVEKVMLKHEVINEPLLEEIFMADEWARKEAEYLVY